MNDVTVHIPLPILFDLNGLAATEHTLARLVIYISLKDMIKEFFEPFLEGLLAFCLGWCWFISYSLLHGSHLML